MLVGRGDELRFLGGLLERVGEGGGAAVVRGGAGIGKSALLSAVARQAAAREMRILTATGVGERGADRLRRAAQAQDRTPLRHAYSSPTATKARKMNISIRLARPNPASANTVAHGNRYTASTAKIT